MADPMHAGMEMSAEEFEMHVAEALDEIPAELAALIDNCVILVEDYPPPDLPDTLGLYSGIPLTERGEFYTGLPDHILIFRYPILAICDTPRAGHRRDQGHRRTRDRPSLRDRRRSAPRTRLRLTRRLSDLAKARARQSVTAVRRLRRRAMRRGRSSPPAC